MHTAIGFPFTRQQGVKFMAKFADWYSNRFAIFRSTYLRDQWARLQLMRWLQACWIP